jgi:hypothetical protein
MARKKHRVGRVARLLDELANALSEFDSEEELKAVAPYVDADTVKSVIFRLQAIIGE